MAGRAAPTWSKPLHDWSGFFHAFALVAIIFLAYSPVLDAGFVWDDDRFLTQNPLIRARDGLYRFWFTTESFDYFPMTLSMLWLEWRLFGEAAAGYHVINLLLHAANTLILWRLFSQMNLRGAWLGALLFGLHPVNVESVAWITERKNTLCMFFFLWSVLWFLRFERLPSLRAYLLSIGFFFLALLSKTAVVMWPCVMLLHAWWRRGEIHRRDLIATAPFFMVSLAMGLLTLWFQYQVNIGTDVIREDGFFSRLVGAAMAVWFYLGKAVLPIELCFVYPRWEIDVQQPAVHLAWMALLVALGVCWRWRSSWGRTGLFALGFFILMLAPVLGLMDVYFMRYSLVADHWQYFALIAVAAGTAGLIIRSAEWIGKPQAARPFLIALACLLAAVTWSQAHVYRSEEALWRDTIQKNPGAWMAHGNLALLYLNQGRNGETLSLFQEALRRKPDAAHIRTGFGMALYNLGRWEEAAAQHEQALKTDPASADAHNNFGAALAVQGKLDQAARHYEEALRLNPMHVSALNNLAQAFILKGEFEEGIRRYRRALSIDPGFAEAHYNLANALRGAGQMEEAVHHFEQAIRLSPGSANAHLNLGAVLADLGRDEDAARHYRKAAELNPGSPKAYYNLGLVMAKRGLWDEAVMHFRRALQLDPGYARARLSLETALAQKIGPEPAEPKVQGNTGTDSFTGGESRPP